MCGDGLGRRLQISLWVTASGRLDGGDTTPPKEPPGCQMGLR